MSVLSPSNLETADYGTSGWNAIYSSNFQKLNDYLAKFEDLWNSTPDNWNILRYDSSTSKWIKDTIANLSAQLESYLAKIDLSNVDNNTILTKLLNVDGSGSGLDADLLDGQDSSYYTNSSNIDYDNTTSGLTATNIQAAIDELDGKIDDIESGDITVGNADKLDGKHASDLAYKDLSNVRIAKKTITSDYTTTESDCYIFADASSGNISITLTTIEGQELMIKKTDSSSNTVTITPSSGNIEGNSSLTLSSQYEYYRLYCDGTNWWKV